MRKPAKLRRRDIVRLIIAASLAIIVILAGNWYFINDHLQWVNQVAEERDKHIVAEVRRDVKDMQRDSADYSTWPELMKAVQIGDISYLQQNIKPETLATINADFCALYYNGRLVFTQLATGYSIDQELQDGLAALFKADGLYGKEQAENTVNHGFCKVGWANIMFASNPLENGQGRVLFAKFVDMANMLQNAKEADVKVTIQDVRWADVPESIRTRVALNNHRLVYEKEAERDLSGYIIMRSANSNPFVFYLNQGTISGLAVQMFAIAFGGLIVMALLVLGTYKTLVALILARLGISDKMEGMDGLNAFERNAIRVENILIDSVEVEKQIESLELQMTPGKAIDEERVRFMAYINDFVAILGQENKSLNPKRYEDYKSSRFGKWLYGRGEQSWGKYPVFNEIKTDQQKLAKLMADIAFLYNARKTVNVWEGVPKVKQLAQDIDRKLYRLTLIRNELNWQTAQTTHDLVIKILLVFAKSKKAIKPEKQ